MVSQLKWTFRSRSANNASYHHRHGGVAQVTASARLKKKVSFTSGRPICYFSRDSHEAWSTGSWAVCRLSPCSWPLFRGWPHMIGIYWYDYRSFDVSNRRATKGIYFGQRSGGAIKLFFFFLISFFCIIVGHAEGFHTALGKAKEP